jgi:cyclic pyranopterin phosphate synthase
MQDKYGRTINYLRISVTDRCNLRCQYCMPEGEIKWLRHEDILSFEEIVAAVKTAVQLGIDKVRLTGGEPLVRRDIVHLVEMLAAIKGIKDLAMTTNAILLPKYAQDLHNAGLQRVNISLDTLDAKRFYTVTRGGNIQDVIAGIYAAQTAELLPIKLNCIIGEPFIAKDKAAVSRFARENNFAVQFIELMDLKAGKFAMVQGGAGGDCKNCNRLRLLSDGTIRPCLFSNIGFNIRELGIKSAFTQAIEHKPKQGQHCDDAWMYKIGG